MSYEEFKHCKLAVQVFPPENSEGNTEYKRMMKDPSQLRMSKLITQMLYRLHEGKGNAIYQVGVEDDGKHSGLTRENIKETVAIFEIIARDHCESIVEKEYLEEIIEGRNVCRCTLTVSKRIGSSPETGCDDDPSESSLEANTRKTLRIAVCGNVDAGKSTMIGALTTNQLDDGRGKTRLFIMKHRHEIETGRTSTAASHLLGFNADGNVLVGSGNKVSNFRKTDEEIARDSDRLITFMDLAGHEKYLKTTVYGVSSGMADYAMILVNARQPPTHMTHHHLNLCASMAIPVLVVLTKVDGCPEHALASTIADLHAMLRAPDVNKRPFMIRTADDVDICMDKLERVAPIINTSCLTGQGLDLLKRFLFTIPKRRHHEKKMKRQFEFLIDDIYNNVPGVGSVVAGFVNAGSISVGQYAHIGPMDDGSYIKTLIKSLQLYRNAVTTIKAGMNASIALKLTAEERKRLRRGHVLLENPFPSAVSLAGKGLMGSIPHSLPDHLPPFCREFDAEICVLKGDHTTIRKNYQAFLHILMVRQSAYAKNIELIDGSGNDKMTSMPSSLSDADQEENDSIILRPGSRARVTFVFCKRPEFVRPGMRLLFRDGRVRGIGIINNVRMELSPAPAC
jgi:elongation factor 1-alpha